MANGFSNLKTVPGVKGTELVYKDKSLIGTIEQNFKGQRIVRTHPMGFVIGEYTSAADALKSLSSLSHLIDRDD